MRSLLNRLLPVGLCVLLFGCSAFGPQLETPEVFLLNITPLESTLFEQRLATELRVRNPNDVDLEITGLDVEIAINGTRLTRVLSSDKVTVPRFGEATVKAIASTTTTSLLRQVAALQRSGGADPTYAISGYVYLGNRFGRRVRLDHSGKLLPDAE